MSAASEIWLDAQLSPALAPWIELQFGVATRSVARLGLRDATDEQIFSAGREANAIVVTKDGDFQRLLVEQGPPPRVVWLTFGNTSNAHVKRVLHASLPEALAMLAAGESLVEIARAA